MTDYPALRFLVRYGSWLAVGVGLIPLLAAALAVALGCHPAWLAAGLVGSAFAWLVVKSYAEMVAVIVDMLLPK